MPDTLHATDCFALFLLTQTPLHAGAGSTLTAIDLPIQREIHTQHPVVWASGVKGALRELAGAGSKKISKGYEAIFGPDTDGASDHGGLGLFSEARVILFPAATTEGIFVWVTCPLVLARLARDLGTLEGSATGGPDNAAAKNFLGLAVPKVSANTVAFSRSDNDLSKIHFDAGASLKIASEESGKVKAIAEWLREHAFPLGAGCKYWRERLPKALAIVPDDEFHFLVNYATQLQSHVKIGSTGTVEAGPWIEECLPSETLLMAPIVVPPVLNDKVTKKLEGYSKKELVKTLLGADDRHFQMCGGRSTGMGWVAARLFSL